MTRWLVTGGSGFIGQHLLDRLGREPVEVVAIGRRPIDKIGLRWIEVDLADDDQVLTVLRESTPTTIFHLAGRTPPADRATFEAANHRATANLFHALALIGQPTRVICLGSAAELGPVPRADLPVGESYLAQPETDYGQSKLAATQVALAARSPIEAVVARVFNPIGPGTPTSQALGRFASLLAKGSERITLEAGDLSPKRDFVDVRDVAEAMVALAHGSGTGLYHVGSGESRSVAEGLENLIRLSGREVLIVVDPLRSPGPADSRAKILRIVTETGWTPQISFEQSLNDLWYAARAGRD